MEGEARSRREDETVERVWFVASTPFLPLGVCFFWFFLSSIRFSLFYPLALDFALNGFKGNHCSAFRGDGGV